VLDASGSSARDPWQRPRYRWHHYAEAGNGLGPLADATTVGNRAARAKAKLRYAWASWSWVTVKRIVSGKAVRLQIALMIGQMFSRMRPATIRAETEGDGGRAHVAT